MATSNEDIFGLDHAVSIEWDPQLCTLVTYLRPKSIIQPGIFNRIEWPDLKFGYDLSFSLGRYLDTLLPDEQPVVTGAFLNGNDFNNGYYLAKLPQVKQMINVECLVVFHLLDIITLYAAVALLSSKCTWILCSLNLKSPFNFLKLFILYEK